MNLLCPCLCRRTGGNKSWGGGASPVSSLYHTRGSSSPVRIRVHAQGHAPCTQIRSFPFLRGTPSPSHALCLCLAFPSHGRSPSQSCHTPLHPPSPPTQIFSSRDERSFSYLRRKGYCSFFKNKFQYFLIFSDEPQKGRGSGRRMVQTLPVLGRS